MSKALKKFVDKLRAINKKEGKRWVDLNNVPKKLWAGLEKEELIRVFHPDIKRKGIPLYWVWTTEGKQLAREKEINLKGLDPQFWITGDEEGPVRRQSGVKWPDSVSGVKSYIGDHNLKETYNLSEDLEILPDPNIKNKWLVIDHKKKLGLLIDLMEDPTGGVPEYDYDEVIQYSKKKRKEGAIEELRKLADELKESQMPPARSPFGAPKGFDPIYEAREIRNYVENAVGDVAFEHWKSYEDTGWALDPQITKHIERLKTKGVQDIVGRLGDDLYNDVDVLESLMGDQVYDKGQTKEQRKEIVEALRKLQSFDAWNRALDSIAKLLD